MGAVLACVGATQKRALTLTHVINLLMMNSPCSKLDRWLASHLRSKNREFLAVTVSEPATADVQSR